MKWMAAAALLTLSAPAAFAQSAAPNDADATAALYSRLSNAFTGGALRAGHDRDFLVLGDPGFVVSPDHLKKGASQESLSRFMDHAPSVSSSKLWCQPLQDDGTRTVSGIYKGILSDSNLCREANIGGKHMPPGVDAFYTTKADYDRDTDALMVREIQFLEAQDTIPGRLAVQWALSYQALHSDANTAVSDALDGYMRTPDLTELEKTATQPDPPQITFYPSPENWSSNDGWNTIKLEIGSQTPELPGRVKAADLKGCSFLTIGAAKAQAANLTLITMDVKAVAAVRPSLDLGVFTARTWRWNDLTKNPLSDGKDPRLGQVPKGTLPLIPTGLLLARNVTITGDFSAAAGKRDTICWGPFTFQSGGEDGIQAAADGKTIQIKGEDDAHPTLQVIGVFCEVVPKSPDPDPSLTWEPAL